MSKIRRVCFFGEPCAGKSTVSAYIYSLLSKDGYNVELIREQAKKIAVKKQEIKRYDQLNLLSQQIQEELVFLNNDTDIIVTDCSPLLNAFYAEYYNLGFSKQYIEIAKTFEKDYKTINILLNNSDNKAYKKIGRYEDEKEAKNIKNELICFLNKNTKVDIIVDRKNMGDKINPIFPHIKNKIENI